MILFEIIGLLVKVLYRLLLEYPRNFRLLESRMVFHSNPENNIIQNFNNKKLKQYSLVATIGLACLEHLSKRNATDFQKKSMLIGCAIAPIIDDLMDEKGYSGTEIQQIVHKKTQRGTLEERVVLGLLEDLDKYAPDLHQSEIWSKAIDFQIRSNQPIKREIEQNELIELSFGKGGYGLLLAMHAVFPELISTENGRNAFYNVGAIIQFVDDLFDVWNDREEGQQTLITNCEDINELVQLFDSIISETNQLLTSLELPKTQISTFIFELKCYTSLGKIALTQLHSLQKKSGGSFNFENFSRKELVTDMEVFSNRVKYLRLVLFN